MEKDTKTKIKEMTEEIKLLSFNFKKKDYPYETAEQKIERQKLFQNKVVWGIITVRTGTGTIENTIESTNCTSN